MWSNPKGFFPYIIIVFLSFNHSLVWRWQTKLSEMDYLREYFVHENIRVAIISPYHWFVNLRYKQLVSIRELSGWHYLVLFVKRVGEANKCYKGTRAVCIEVFLWSFIRKVCRSCMGRPLPLIRLGGRSFRFVCRGECGIYKS